MSNAPLEPRPRRDHLHEVIFEADTPSGKAFDVMLLVTILLSVLAVILESDHSISARLATSLVTAEWIFTVFFTIEYTLRIIAVRRPLRYVFSFFGIVDLLAILPTYLSLIFPGAHSLLVIRAFRLLRVFRIFKLARFLTEASALREAIWASREKVIVFIVAVVIVVVIMGAAMNLVEGQIQDSFNSIPKCMYWAIVTMTTVGYGDVTPITPIGKTLAAVIMVLGYSFIIVPTGIISAELAQAAARPVSTQVCPHCSLEGHDVDARHCKYCGESMRPEAV